MVTLTEITAISIVVCTGMACTMELARRIVPKIMHLLQTTNEFILCGIVIGVPLVITAALIEAL